MLPFVDLSAGGSDAYFGDGLAEELLNALAGVPDLKVAARTSSFAFRGAERDVREIGQALNVETVLEGSVRRDDDSLRVTAQLIDAATGYHLWSDEYDASAAELAESGSADGSTHSSFLSLGPRFGFGADTLERLRSGRRSRELTRADTGRGILVPILAPFPDVSAAV